MDNFISIISSSATSLVLARELQEVLSQLLVQWETELLHLEGRSLQTPGCPKIILNVEMISVYLAERIFCCNWLLAQPALFHFYIVHPFNDDLQVNTCLHSWDF